MSNLVLSTRFISARIDAVFDVYEEYSVKNAERENGDVKTVFILKKKKKKMETISFASGVRF